MTWPPVLLPDSDALGVDAWRDELATDDPYTQDWVPARTHGPVCPPDGAALFAALPPSHPVPREVVAGRSESADAHHPVDF